MNIESLSQEHILSETKKLQYLCSLKDEIRYAQTRGAEDVTESVAEHVYGMHILSLYFLPLEDPEGAWDKVKISAMITLHDTDEIETGDILSQLKTPEIRAAEGEAMKKVVANAPESMQEYYTAIIEEYEARETPEARFVKAIDVFEPMVQIYSEKWKSVLHRNQTTLELSIQIKERYIKDFHYIPQFADVLHEQMDKEGYFYSE